MVRKHMRFTGQVQGVGFRFHASHAARHIGLTGWVRNEWDGSVEMEVQGTEDQIDDLIISLQRTAFIQIDNIDMKNIPLDEFERGFRVSG